MRKVLLTIAGSLLLSACGGGDAWSPSDPRTFDRSMIDTSQLAGLSMPKRAYVEGHAIGVYLMGKTLPGQIQGHHYLYWPGISSPHAEVAYKWKDIMIATSGGYDGNGSTTDDSASGAPHTGQLGDDVGIGGGDPSNDPSDGSGSGSGSGSGGGGGGGDGCGEIDAACQTFLGPAADRATTLGNEVDPMKFVDPGLQGADVDQFVREFQLGMKHALALPSTTEWANASEVDQLQGLALEVGMCETPIVE
jgi:hypothetical protein